jgi:scyllo-inositol 2-dehydrogenase (NAD+)
MDRDVSAYHFRSMKTLKVAVIGVGWIGSIRAHACAGHPIVENLHLAEIRADVAAEVGAATRATRVTADYRELLELDLDAVIVSTAPETTHYPIARDCLLAGKHVLLEKPMGLTLGEADDLIATARERNLKLMIGYSQRFNPKFAFLKQLIKEGKLGLPVTGLVSRHITRAIGAKIAGRGELGPAQMEGTHDVDLMLWFLSGSKPTKVYAQSTGKVMRPAYGLPDCTWMIVTMDDDSVFTVGSNWNLPLETPGLSTTTIEFVGTDGAVFIDDSHKDILVTSVDKGLQRPLATMPGQQVGHVYQGPMEQETRHFLDCVAYDRPTLVTPEEARAVMEVTLAADLSADRGEAVRLPLVESHRRT